MSGEAEDIATEQPLLRVVAGDPTPEELAALVAVVAAAGTGPSAPARPPRPWSAPARGLRTPLHAGRGAWRASALPR